MKKKWLFLIFLASICLVVIGCKEDKCKMDQDINGAGLPDECYDCQWYAPDSAILSSAGYNTVSQIRNRFVCHKKTLYEHTGDTLNLMGWLYWGNEETGEWIPNYMTGDIGAIIFLTDRENHLGADHTLMVFLDSEHREKFRENYNEMLEKKWGVRGILRWTKLDSGSICCSLIPYLELLEIDTLNTSIL